MKKTDYPVGMQVGFLIESFSLLVNTKLKLGFLTHRLVLLRKTG